MASTDGTGHGEIEPADRDADGVGLDGAGRVARVSGGGRFRRASGRAIPGPRPDPGRVPTGRGQDSRWRSAV